MRCAMVLIVSKFLRTRFGFLNEVLSKPVKGVSFPFVSIATIRASPGLEP